MNKELEGDSVLILGYGREGRSTHKFLLEHYPQKRIGIADKNPQIKPLFQPEALFLGEDYLDNLSEFDVIIRSPGVPLRTPELQHALSLGKILTSEMNIFFSECPGTIIGITGTKGKSTTSALIAAILSKAYDDVRLVGNIGLPALDFLSNATESSIFVAELSSYQLEDIKYSPQYAVLLGISQEHLDHHGNFAEYVRAKERIYQFQREREIVVFNSDNDLSRQLANTATSEKFAFSLNTPVDRGAYINHGKVVFRDSASFTKEPIVILDVDEIPLLGTGNLENALAAVSIGVLLRVSPRFIQQAIQEFTPLPHRLQFLGEKNGIRFYDDSLATIPEATINAIEALGEDVETLLAGGYDRGVSFEQLGRYLINSSIKNLILFPTSGERIWAEIEKHSHHDLLIKKFYVSAMEEAVKIALETTTSGKICLLSPASPSFGVFKDYADRGDQFKKLLGLEH